MNSPPPFFHACSNTPTLLPLSVSSTSTTSTKSKTRMTITLENMCAPLYHLCPLSSFLIPLKSWIFRHPDFHADRRHALENIERKVPAQRKAQQAAAVPQAQSALLSLPSTPNTSLLAAPNAAPTMSDSIISAGSASAHLASAPALQMQNQFQIEQLQLQVRRLTEEGDDLRTRLRTLERNYDNILVQFVAFQRGMAQQDDLIQNLTFLGNDNGKPFFRFLFVLGYSFSIFYLFLLTWLGGLDHCLGNLPKLLLLRLFWC